MQGARSAATETVHAVRRGGDNAVAAQAHIGVADVKPLGGGRSHHRATPQTTLRSNF